MPNVRRLVRWNFAENVNDFIHLIIMKFEAIDVNFTFLFGILNLKLLKPKII